MIVNLKTVVPDKLVCEQGRRRQELVDIGGTGLYCEVRATSPGQGTYYLRYKDANGKTCHQKIGRTGDIDLDEARARAKTLKARITLKDFPRDDEDKSKNITFKQLMEDHYMPYVKPRKRSWKKDQEMLDNRLQKAFGHKQLHQISRQQIQTFQTSLLEDEKLSPATANHHVKLVRHALNLAVEWELLEKSPATKIPMLFEDNQNSSYLEASDLKQLLAVLQTDKNRQVCLIALFLLSTGARLNEALQATWKLCDKENRVWRIPASNSKSKKMRSVPLNDSAIDVLDQLDTEGEFEHLFINRKTGKPYVTIQKVWQRLRTKAGLPHVNIHMLRHSFASYLIINGRSLYSVQRILGHSNPSVTQRYAHLSNKALQEASDCAADFINDALKDSP